MFEAQSVAPPWDATAVAPCHGATPQEQLLGKVEDCPSIERTVQYSTVRSVVRVKPTTFKSKPADRLTV